MRPVLDYGSSVWDAPGVVLQEELESVQKRVARFVTGNYNYETGSMTGILGQLKWESLKKRRKDNRLILLHKGLKGKASVTTDDLIPKTRRCRNQHSMAFQIPIANTNVYKGSFFPQTIRDWNALPDSLISSAEDAEGCIAKLTSLVLFPNHRGARWLSGRVSDSGARGRGVVSLSKTLYSPKVLDNYPGSGGSVPT